MLARQNGWLECADLLHDWLQNKDKDLKEREIHPTSISTDPQEGSTRSKIHVKRSIDNALNKFKCEAPPKVPLPTSPTPSIRCQLDPPSPLSPPIADDVSFLTLEPISDPKLSHKLSPPPTQSGLPSVVSNSLPRPRSAGTGTDPMRNTSPTSKRLGTKYSLLHMFRKAQATGEDATSPADTDVQQHNSMSTSPPASESTSPIDLSHSVLLSSSPNATPTSPHDTPSRPFPSSSASDAESRVYPSPVDKHRTIVQNHHRVHSSASIGGHGETGDHQRPSTSPRNHIRSSSHGQSHLQHSGSRYAPRFDSTSSSTNIRHGAAHHVQQPHESGSRGSPLGRLKPSRSAQSLQRVMAMMAFTSVTLAPNMTASDHPRAETSTPGDDDEDEYGVPVEHSRFADGSANGYQPDALPRERSISSSSSSISHGIVGDMSSYVQPSPLNLDEQLLSVPLHTGRSDSSRTRGDSVSSMSTNGSTVPQMTSSSTSSASKSSANPTPGPEDVYLPPPIAKLHESTLSDPAISSDDHTLSPYRMHHVLRRPLDIDIRSISSHAQAEALVQRAQHAILDMTDELNADNLSSPGPSTGRTPLSARLAAYGESLAIQRMLREEEERRATASLQDFDDDEEDFAPSQPTDIARNVGATYSVQEEVVNNGHARKASSTLDRQLSLERKSSVGSRSRIYVPKRPSTSAGITSDVGGCFLSVIINRPEPSSQKTLPIATHHPQSRSISSSTSTDGPPVSSSLWMTEQGSLEVSAVDDETVAHIPLSDTLSDSVADKGRGGRSRQLSSANKLTRMGFANPDGRLPATQGSLPRSVSGNKTVFGFKTLMQTLKGRP